MWSVLLHPTVRSEFFKPHVLVKVQTWLKRLKNSGTYKSESPIWNLNSYTLDINFPLSVLHHWAVQVPLYPTTCGITWPCMVLLCWVCNHQQPLRQRYWLYRCTARRPRLGPALPEPGSDLTCIDDRYNMKCSALQGSGTCRMWPASNTICTCTLKLHIPDSQPSTNRCVWHCTFANILCLWFIELFVVVYQRVP